MVLPGLEVYSSVTTCRHVASSLATSAQQNVNVLVLPVYSFATSVLSVSVHMSVSLYLLQAWVV